jgi:hypothetical protein
MPTEKKELLMRIIDLAESVRSRGLDPFDVEVKEFFDRLRELLPRLSKSEDLYLDIQAVLGLADVVYEQGEWIKSRSSMLYLDPLLIMLKLHALSPRDLAEVLVRSWHPIIELESLSPHGIKEGLDYWKNLPSLEDRFGGLETTEVMTGEMARKELARMGILTDEDFATVLDKLWRELKDAVGRGGEISYWRFVSERTFKETVSKAWLVSFLVSYGYATLEVKPLEEEIILRPLTKPQTLEPVVTFSVPISISREDWLRRKRHA